MTIRSASGWWPLSRPPPFAIGSVENGPWPTVGQGGSIAGTIVSPIVALGRGHAHEFGPSRQRPHAHPEMSNTNFLYWVILGNAGAEFRGLKIRVSVVHHPWPPLPSDPFRSGHMALRWCLALFSR